MTINEGKNREIRKIFEHLGYKVIDLERISVGCVSKYSESAGTLEAGHIRDLTEKEIEFFFNQKDKKLKEIENIFSSNDIDNIENFESVDKDDKTNDKNKKENKILAKRHNKSKWAKPKNLKKKIKKANFK